MGCRSLFTDLQIARMRCWVDQDFGPTSPVLPDMGAGLVTLKATVKYSTEIPAGYVALAWLPPSSEAYCPAAAGCVSKYLVQRRATAADAWVTIGTNARADLTTPPLRTLDDKAPLATSAQYSVVAEDASARQGARFYVDVTRPWTAAPTFLPGTTAAPTLAPSSFCPSLPPTVTRTTSPTPANSSMPTSGSPTVQP